MNVGIYCKNVIALLKYQNLDIIQ